VLAEVLHVATEERLGGGVGDRAVLAEDVGGKWM
jgi:hypothetical protein